MVNNISIPKKLGIRIEWNCYSPKELDAARISPEDNQGTKLVYSRSALRLRHKAQEYLKNLKGASVLKHTQGR
jgi:hypothetical protein